MSALLLFGIVSLLVLAAFVLILGFQVTFDPFCITFVDTIPGLALSLVIAPAIFVGAFFLNDYRNNYCPPLEPIAAPDLADAPPAPPILHDDELIKINHDLALRLDRTKTLLAAKTIELHAAAIRIRELEARSKAQRDLTFTEQPLPTSRQSARFNNVPQSSGKKQVCRSGCN